MSDPYPTLDALVEPVRRAGRAARRRQRSFAMDERTRKRDGSVVTEIDGEVEDMLAEDIRARFPEAHIIGEERERTFEKDAAYYLAVDPIDGTDAFSQGMPGWVVCVGLVTPDGIPQAGIVYAPAWEELFVAPGDGRVLRNGKPIEGVSFPDGITPRTNLMGDSRIHRLFDLGEFPGKVRSVGSTALHLCQMLIYDGVIAAFGRPCKIWDVAAAHAVVRAAGYHVELFDERPLDYEALLRGARTRDLMIGGASEGLDLLREAFPRRKTLAAHQAGD